MIEQSVSLASNGVVKVPGYEQLVRFGYTKNRGVYRLHVDATAAEQAKTDAQTAASEATTSAGNADESAQKAANSLQELKDGIANGDFKGEKGDPGPAVALDTTLTHEGEAADAKATGDAISAVKARQNVLVGTETGNPIAVDDAFPAPLCGLTVYGKSTQDGTPTPDAPVPIVSAGDGGTIAVKVTGKNRMPPNLKTNDVIECFIKKNTLITLVFKGDLVSKGGNILFFSENNEQQWFGIDIGNAEQHITLRINATKFKYLLKDTISENVCLTWNASSPDYEPYREQLLTLPTPNGLPGIPVTSGGNYTDQSSQQWVCDEVDLEKGMKVQRIDKAAFDRTKTLAEQNAILATPIETPLTPDEIAAYKALTAYGPDTVVQAGDGAGVKLEYQRDVNIAIKRIEDAVASMT